MPGLRPCSVAFVPNALSSNVRLAELDGIRGIAILFILIWHYIGIPMGIQLQPDSWIPNFQTALIFFKSGVDLFFTLSGFLIAGILIENQEAPFYYRVFYFRRICRIFPFYYTLVVIFIIARIAGADGPLFAGKVPLASYVTMTQNYFMAGSFTYGAAWLGATWSLAIEEQFYLLFPLVVRHSRKTLPWILLSGIVLAPVLRIWCYRHFGNDWAAYTWLPCRLDSLCWGALLAYLLRRPRALSIIGRQQQWIIGMFGVLLVGAFVLSAALPRNIGYHMSFWGHSLLAALYTFSILLAVFYEGRLCTVFLRFRPLIFLGQISYGVYLVHGISLIAVFLLAGRAVGMRNLTEAGLIALALGITLSVCVISHRWLELPFQKMGKRLKYTQSL